jgi:hypothetical protein
MKIFLPLLLVFLVGCYNFQKDIIKLSPGDTKSNVLEIMGDPNDSQFNGDLEVWQYFGVVSFGSCDYRQIWFRNGRLIGTTSYRSVCAAGCAPCLRTLDFSRPPDQTIENRQR